MNVAKWEDDKERVAGQRGNGEGSAEPATNEGRNAAPEPLNFSPMVETQRSSACCRAMTQAPRAPPTLLSPQGRSAGGRCRSVMAHSAAWPAAPCCHSKANESLLNKSVNKIQAEK
ncbi:hypothetical protein AAY473_018519 [Plecturocebus cupreus]